MFNKAGEIKSKWENFITDPEKRESLQPFIRNDILDSWSRCQTIGLNPEQKHARTALTSHELNNLLTESALYRAAKPIIDYIYHTLVGTGYLITLNDETGRMIYLKGESEMMRKVEKVNFSPGMDWSESAAGTNAIGTSIVAQKPIQVFSAEHFCEGFHSMTCSSAPVFHPFSKQVMGAIDFTGLWPSTQPHTLGLAVSLAQMIEQQLLVMYKQKYTQLEEYYRVCTAKWKNQPILVFSNDYVLINGNHQLLHALNLTEQRTNESHVKIKKLLEHPEKSLNKVDDYQFIQIKPIIINHEEIGYVVIFNHKKGHSLSSLSPSKTHQLIGESAEIKLILQKGQQLASIDTPILVTGETGTGKELVARYLHEVSSRKDKPFIAINCGAIQKDLLASELFGYESGTFTGGKKEGKRGKFEEANGGTIFLDEIGEMPLDSQVHLLRVLQEKEITRLGSSKNIKIDVKIIGATNRNLEEMIEEGKFRKDLYFRLNVISFKVPSLRERKEDILPICEYYLSLFTKKYDKTSYVHLSEKTKRFFLSYSWPGNIRELRNAIEHAVIFSDSVEIDRSYLPDYLADLKSKNSLDTQTHSNLNVVENTERQQIQNLLIETDWNISAVSRELNVARTTLYRKMRKYKIREK
nr:sigma-54-dependent Fis family transcriptional regulator [Mesobacillus maritimus]